MKHFITIIAALTALCSCIKNDIPYPIVELEVTAIDVEGAVVAPVGMCVVEASLSITVQLYARRQVLCPVGQRRPFLQLPLCISVAC